jgi:hypothetical protein
MEEFNLDHLSLKQIERAFKYLANQYERNPPQELENLNLKEWQQLECLLVSLEAEKQFSQVH